MVIVLNRLAQELIPPFARYYHHAEEEARK